MTGVYQVGTGAKICHNAETCMTLCGVPTPVPSTRRWSASGTLWLTDVRLVFVAPAANADGLQAFDFPLAYITHDKFNQPIFACNNLAGQGSGSASHCNRSEHHAMPLALRHASVQSGDLAKAGLPCWRITGKVWPATGGGGPAGTLPPHEYKLYFKASSMGYPSAFREQ
jgi:WW domain-binding protein 2